MKDKFLKFVIGLLIFTLVYALIGTGYNIVVDPSSFSVDFLLK